MRAICLNRYKTVCQKDFNVTILIKNIVPNKCASPAITREAIQKKLQDVPIQANLITQKDCVKTAT